MVLGVVVERPVAFGADLRWDQVSSWCAANTIATETNHQAASLRTNPYRVRRGRCVGYYPVLDAGPRVARPNPTGCSMVAEVAPGNARVRFELLARDSRVGGRCLAR